MEISKEQIELWVKELEKFNTALDELEDKILNAEENGMSAKEYEEINKQIDININRIGIVQGKIEKEIISRSLTDDKAKQFIDEEKAELQDKVDEKNDEIKELEETQEKIEENEKMKKINDIIQEKFNLEQENKDLQIEKDALEKNIIAIEDEIEKSKIKLNDPTITKDERIATLDRMKVLSKEKTSTNIRINDIKSKMSENVQAISDIQDELGDYGVPGAFENEINTYYGSTGATYSENEKLDAIVQINNDEISKNKADIRKIAKDKLGMKARFVKEEEIKKVLEEKIAQSKEEFERLKERGVGFNETDLVNKVKTDLESNINLNSQPQKLEDIINKVVNERKNLSMGIDIDDASSANGTGNVNNSRSNLPATVSKKEKVGFFRDLYETIFSKEFSKKRIQFAQEMYPELSEKQIRKYINSNTDALNNMIRNDITLDDIKEAKLMQKAQREERKNNNENNDFITKLRETISNGGNIQQFGKDRAEEKAKKAKEDLKNARDEK